MTSAFPKSGRFEYISRLGAGGTGVVYAVYDREKQQKAAIKTLSRADRQAVLCLKNEIRALQDLQHRNLVSCGELFESDGQWFFTMELVDGVDFIQYVRGSDDKNLGGDGCGTGVPGFDEGKLREAFRQLAVGLSALHETGRVHRDVKPPNVLVDRDGRVVLMDFGIASRVDPGSDSAEQSGLVGTVAYMAPEQTSSVKVGSGADWYSAGVILYESLTGRLPFEGTAYEVINAKHSNDPPRPRSIVSLIPEDLDELCMRLLHRDPGRRPDAAAVLSVLKGSALTRKELDTALFMTRVPVFVGRERELECLHQIFRCSQGGPIGVLVHGESGMGKSRLLGEFTERVRADFHGAAVLFGRCNRRNPIRLNAFDGVLEDLESFLLNMPEKEVLSLVPRNAHLLITVFPELSRVSVLDAESSTRRVSEDIQMVRTMGFDGLRELLTQLGRSRRVLLIMDDFQWADRDSMGLLRALFQPPDAPSVFLVLCMSRDGEKTLTEFDAIKRLVLIEFTEMEIGPLHINKAVEAARMLSMEHPGEALPAERIGVESKGRPLLLQQLVRHVEEGGGGSGTCTLEDVLESRTSGLEPQTRELLQIVCISGAPLDAHTAAAVLEENIEKTMLRLTKLRWMNLIGSGGSRREDLFQPYHELVRKWVVSEMDPEVRIRLHGLLFRVLKAAGGVSPGRLSMHLEEAGETRRAVRFAIDAALEASSQFAFNRASALYFKALENLERPETPVELEEMRQMIIRLADSLAMAGRGPDAAKAYLKALKGANMAEQLRLEHLAASQLLMSGRLDEGLDIIDNVAKRLGVRLPRTPWRTLLSFLLRRIHIRVRGLRFSLKDPSQVTPEKLERVDLWLSVAVGLAVSDNMHAADFNTRWIMKALEVGEPDRVMQALALESVFVASLGKRGTRYYKRLANNVNKSLDERKSKIVQAYLGAGRGYGAFMAGEWRSAGDAFEKVERLMLGRPDSDYEFAAVRFVILWSQFYLGELDAMTRRLMPMVRMAMDRGDVFAASGMFLGLANVAYLNRDGPEAARREVDDMISRWITKGYHLQHYWALLARVHIALYKGSGKEAVDLVEKDRPALKKSLLILMPAVANEGSHLRARALLAAAAESENAERKKIISQAGKITRRLGRKKLGWMKALALLLDGAVCFQRGNLDLSKTRLEAAVEALDSHEMGLYAASARWRLAELIGGDEGEEYRRIAEDFMNRQKVRNMECMVNMLAPGFREYGGKNAGVDRNVEREEGES